MSSQDKGLKSNTARKVRMVKEKKQPVAQIYGTCYALGNFQNQAGSCYELTFQIYF